MEVEVESESQEHQGDGSALYLVGPDPLWMHDLTTGRERPVTALEQRQGTMGVVALAEHGGSLYFTWEEDIGDLWMMERTR